MSADQPIIIRTARESDEPALERLAALDSARPLAGSVLLASVDGDVVAARSLADGRTIADPFVPTTRHLELLKVRARPEGGRQPLRLGALRHALASGR
jgi:hypothetical protein